MRLLLLKLLLTIPVALALIHSLRGQAQGPGVLATVQSIGLLSVVLLAVAFFVAVGFYCRDLQRTLELVRPAARAAAPRSVWLMFLIPYNFVEDFFIVHNVTRSLRAEAAVNPALAGWKHLGGQVGLGWCALQIVSLLPTRLGEAAGALAALLWILHWRIIRRINKALALALNPAVARRAG
jgi:hypothetical protein